MAPSAVKPPPTPPVALTVAGADSGGGAGIAADLKTFAARRVYGTAAITAVTAQNTRGVRRIDLLPPAAVTAQMEAVFDDFSVVAVKTGMLGSAAAVEAVAAALRAAGAAAGGGGLPLVVDPVLVATSGDALVGGGGARGGAQEDDGDRRRSPTAAAAAADPMEALLTAYRKELLPLATLVTPNMPEAAALVGYPVTDTASARAAAADLVTAHGAGAALVKGGHAVGADGVTPPADATDILYDGAAWHAFAAARLETAATHGTGCTTAAAVAAGLARGAALPAAVAAAKAYVHEAMRRAPRLGGGHGPLHHLYELDGREDRGGGGVAGVAATPPSSR